MNQRDRNDILEVTVTARAAARRLAYTPRRIWYSTKGKTWAGYAAVDTFGAYRVVKVWTGTLPRSRSRVMLTARIKADGAIYSNVSDGQMPGPTVRSITKAQMYADARNVEVTVIEAFGPLAVAHRQRT